MSRNLTFQILGVVEARIGADFVRLGGKQRSLLAVLLLQANCTVTNTRLMDAVWGRPLPVAPETRVRTLVSELRRALSRHGFDGIQTKPSGYVIRVEDGQLDLSVFLAKARQAREEVSNGAPGAALHAYDEALALWHGTALTGASGPFVDAETARLEEVRMTVMEERFGALLQLGRPAEVVTDLSRLALLHPLREGLHAQLMTALYRCGRRSEALDLYRSLRSRLVRELGMEPLTELRDLQQHMLSSEPVPNPALHDQLTGPVHARRR
ncbi:AfsR/SARP family transcriptional regulator [Streptomyces canus]|uniref:AfsR/SARP family transcriptional regulator n=1 Tax=Streptomyces canus TaxID=58343 RepID=UPI0022515D57|nr:AfsR/SARP family transcriptional regulator [Streptomyces canus]MCX4852738.1 AfsR/SARP family transcriptional regulator [Streptomyces canus]